MTTAEKLAMTKSFLRLADDSEDNLIETYLLAASTAILDWRWGSSSTRPETLPADLEMTQIMAVVAGYSISGAEGETMHVENTVTRIYKYEDMLAYIHAHVIPICKVI